MAHFAPVAPVWLYKQMQELGILGGYHLLLAHDVYDNSQAYNDIFGKQFTRLNPGGYIILDNSMIELGHPVSFDIMAGAANVCRPSVLVLPDVRRDHVQTIELSEKACEQWKVLGMDYMVVPQGSDWQHLMECADVLCKLPRVTAVGIPRDYTELFGSRYGIARSYRQKFPALHIHLLGFSNNVPDDIMVSQLPFIRGIDSATPLRAGLDDVMLSSPFEYYGYQSTRGNFFTEEREISLKAIHNVHRVRQWLMNPML